MMNLSAATEDCWSSILRACADDPATICRCAEVCTMFHALCGSDDLRSEELWESICQRRWSGKLNKKIEEGKRARARYRQFSPDNSDASRGTAAAAFLSFLRWQNKVAAAAAPLPSGTTQNSGRCGWKPSLWKLSYFEAEWDSKRTTLTIEDITSRLWRFRFLHYPSPNLVVRYNADFTYDSCMFSGPLPWRFVGASILIGIYKWMPTPRSKPLDTLTTGAGVSRTSTCAWSSWRRLPAVTTCCRSCRFSRI